MTIGTGSGSSRSAGCSAGTAVRSPRPATMRPRAARCRLEGSATRVVLGHIGRVHGDPRIGRGLYGARKVWHELRREQARGGHRELGSVPRCQIERLMRVNNIRGARRDKGPVTTRSQQAAARPADLVKRNFTAFASQRVVGGRLHLRGDLVPYGVQRVRERRVLAAHRRVAHRHGDADPVTPRRLGDGAVDPPTGRRDRRRTHPPQRRRQPKPDSTGGRNIGLLKRV